MKYITNINQSVLFSFIWYMFHILPKTQTLILLTLAHTLRIHGTMVCLPTFTIKNQPNVGIWTYHTRMVGDTRYRNGTISHESVFLQPMRFPVSGLLHLIHQDSQTLNALACSTFSLFWSSYRYPIVFQNVELVKPVTLGLMFEDHG